MNEVGNNLAALPTPYILPTYKSWRRRRQRRLPHDTQRGVALYDPVEDLDQFDGSLSETLIYLLHFFHFFLALFKILICVSVVL